MVERQGKMNWKETTAGGFAIQSKDVSEMGESEGERRKECKGMTGTSENEQ